MKSFFLKSCVAVSFSASSLLAHFGVVIPSANVVEEQEKLLKEKPEMFASAIWEAIKIFNQKGLI